MRRLGWLLLDHDTMLRRRHRKTKFTIKKSLITFTVRTHGKLDAVPLASEPQASRPVVLACGPLAYWPTGLQRLQPVPGDAPFWCRFEFIYRHKCKKNCSLSTIYKGEMTHRKQQ